MPTITYQRPYLYERQTEAIFCDERWGVIEASTKSGKTVGCLVWLHELAALGQRDQNFWWIAPIYPQAKIAYRRLKKMLPESTFFTNESELTITLANGTIIWFKGADNPDSLFGEDVYAAVIDEATRVKEAAWHAVRSTLTATGGPCRIIGNVKGKKNWAYKMARRAEQGAANHHYAKLTVWDAVDAGIFSSEEAEDARATLPEGVWSELYMAEANDDGSNPFGTEAIARCTRPVQAGIASAWGWDLAKSTDWTVGIGLEPAGSCVSLHRFQKPWRDTVTQIRAHTGTTEALVDATGVGDPIVEELQSGGGNFTGFKFTAPSRQALMEGLALAISQERVSYPEEVAEELSEFEYVYTPSGVKYAAPEGLHDDRVMALALAVECQRDAGPVRVRFI